MTRNLANWDRMARLILGVVLIVLAFIGAIGVWGYLGLILVATASVSFCPLYSIVGMKTCKDC